MEIELPTTLNLEILSKGASSTILRETRLVEHIIPLLHNTWCCKRHIFKSGENHWDMMLAFQSGYGGI